MCSVISVLEIDYLAILKSGNFCVSPGVERPGDTQKWTLVSKVPLLSIARSPLVRSWLIRVRLVHSWAV